MFVNLRVVDDFYPRSPCGERRQALARSRRRLDFYPRSPCGERRILCRYDGLNCDFYPRSPCGERPCSTSRSRASSTISIHALLAESDFALALNLAHVGDFYPRSPCGERQFGLLRRAAQIYFYPRSPCGERLKNTLRQIVDRGISIHALLAESDGIGLVFLWWGVRFLSTLSLRRATQRI